MSVLQLVPPSQTPKEDSARAAIDGAIAILEEWRAEGRTDVDVVVLLGTEYPVKVQGEERNRRRVRWSTNCHHYVAVGLLEDGKLGILEEDVIE